MLDQLRLVEPDMPGLCGRDRDLERAPQAIQSVKKLPGRKLVLQEGLVAGDHAINIRILGHRRLDRC